MSNVDRHEPGTPSWFDLMTPDPEKARAFYGALFGWTFQIGGPESGHYSMCQRNGRNAAGIGQMPPGAPFPSTWNVYLAVTSTDESCARIKDKGGAVVMGPMDVMQEGRLAFCADPTGAHFGLWQPKNHHGAGIRDEHGSMTWAEVNTRDAAKAREFYAAVFGLEAKKMEGADIQYWTLHKGPITAGGIMQMDARFPANVPSHWLAYFAVSSCDTSTAQLAKLGGKVMAPAFDTPYGRIAVVTDPFGAPFAIIQLAQTP